MLWFPSDSINKQVNNTKSKNKYQALKETRKKQQRPNLVSWVFSKFLKVLNSNALPILLITLVSQYGRCT